MQCSTVRLCATQSRHGVFFSVRAIHVLIFALGGGGGGVFRRAFLLWLCKRPTCTARSSRSSSPPLPQPRPCPLDPASPAPLPEPWSGTSPSRYGYHCTSRKHTRGNVDDLQCRGDPDLFSFVLFWGTGMNSACATAYVEWPRRGRF